MFFRKLILSLLFFTLYLRAFPAVFTVTSNADSGPGTLRDALTLAAANGSATTDYIYFNIPDQSITGRTISISTQLPNISSHLVIDGTSQPGASFGVSDAKVILQHDSQGSSFSAFICVDVDSFEIYGMYVRDFYGQITNGPAQGVYSSTAVVYIETSSNIQIGAPKKGNVFANNGYVTYTDYVSLKDGQSLPAYGVNNLKVYSNFFGVEPDGVSLRGGAHWGIDVSYCKGNIEIGGQDVSRRNIFVNLYFSITGFFTGRDRLFTSNFLIENNYIGYGINSNAAPLPVLNGSSISAIFFDISRWIFPDEYGKITYPYTFNILNNKIQYPYAIQVSTLSGPITFQGNQINFEPSTYIGYLGGIGLSTLDNLKVGGTNSGESNSIYGSQLYLFSRKSVLIQHNSIYCVNDSRVWVPAVGYLDPPLPLPVVAINNVTATSVSGTATPLSKVELFWDDDCRYCQPLTYIVTVDADANGNWKYNGTIQKGVIASSTLNGFTSLFTTAPVNLGVNITHYSCGKGGSITGGKFQNAGGYQWKDNTGQIIGNDKDITNLAPGKYTLTAQNSTCFTEYSFNIFDATPHINDNYKAVIQPSCNNPGSITGLFVDNSDVLEDAYSRGDYGVYSYRWIDAGGNTVGTSIDLSNVQAGVYHLDVSYKNQCTITYGPITLKNISGPNIDQSHADITSTNCGESTGSITNIQVTGSGTLKYSWLNSQQQQVATALDLVNQPTGTYKLQVTDDSQCGPIFSADILIPETNGISLDESKVQTTVAACGMNNGTITGMQVTGTAQYKWVDANNNVVATTPDLKNAAPGDYTFTAYNNWGCSKTSKTYHVSLQAVTQYPSYAANTVSSCPGQNNGSISISTDALVGSLRWVNSLGQNIGSSQLLNNVSKGTYQLYLTDVNGCETLYNSYAVTELQPLSVISQGQVSADQCNLKNGAVNNVSIIGGQSPYTYTWTDAAGNQIGTGSFISHLAAGDYHLNIADSRCGSLTLNYTITSQSQYVAAPSVSDVQLCTSGDAFISVNNPSSTFNYLLYDDQNSAQPLDQEKSGRFKVTISNNRSYFISQLNGTCESARSEVKVTVGISGVNIPNAFTPNGDGINDYWSLKGMENNPNSLVQVFTRYGQKVFESRGYDHPFDGTSGGKELPSGVYYYIINLGNNCNILSGNVTIIH